MFNNVLNVNPTNGTNQKRKRKMNIEEQRKTEGQAMIVLIIFELAILLLLLFTSFNKSDISLENQSIRTLNHTPQFRESNYNDYLFVNISDKVNKLYGPENIGRYKII
jgi:hypothetical protein